MRVWTRGILGCIFEAVLEYGNMISQSAPSVLCSVALTPSLSELWELVGRVGLVAMIAGVKCAAGLLGLASAEHVWTV